MFRLTSSSLYDQSTFYGRFYKDLRGARRRIDDASSVREMLRFIRLEKWCKSRRLVTQQLATPQPKHLTHSLTYQFFEICSILFACHLL